VRYRVKVLARGVTKVRNAEWAQEHDGARQEHNRIITMAFANALVLATTEYEMQLKIKADMVSR
jgi:hypothetical protein